MIPTPDRVCMLCDSDLKAEELYIKVCQNCTDRLKTHGYLPDFVALAQHWTYEDYRGFMEWAEEVIRG